MVVFSELRGGARSQGSTHKPWTLTLWFSSRSSLCGVSLGSSAGLPGPATRASGDLSENNAWQWESIGIGGLSTLGVPMRWAELRAPVAM